MPQFVIINDFQIPVQVSQQLTNGHPDHLYGLLPGFRETVVPPASFLAVGPWILSIEKPYAMERINDLYSFLPSFVLQGGICWKPDVLRNAGSIQNHGAFVLFLFLSTP